MNTIVNDKLLSLSTHSKASHENKKPIATTDNERLPQLSEQNPGKDDNLDLSTTGQRLNQSALAQVDYSHTSLETVEQASALAAKIRQQFEQVGSQALTAHSAIRRDQIDLLLRPISA